MEKIEQVEEKIRTVLRHWGFDEIHSAIYSTLLLHNRSLTAKEISERINYAYTTTINALNHGIKLRYIKKMRQGRKNVYSISSTLPGIIEEKLNYFLKILEEVRRSINQLDESCKKKLNGTLKTVTDAIHVLRKMKLGEET